MIILAAKRHSPMLPLAVCFIILATMGCSSGLGDLTRESARKLIENSEKFKIPIAVTLKDENERHVQPQSADETEQTATERAMEMYLSDNRQIAVLRHLGYVEVTATVLKKAEIKGSGVFASIKPWIFKIEPSLTEKGKAATKPQTDSTNKEVVLARREVVELTGIRKEGIQAAADFTWKAVPTEAGKAFDPTSDTFKSLPPELQEAVTKSQGVGPFGSSSTVNWNEIYKSTASFQKYDDGWRLAAIRF
jgi:non-canonical (house-cleaning) NTP pyrophosphatase